MKPPTVSKTSRCVHRLAASILMIASGADSLIAADTAAPPNLRVKAAILCRRGENLEAVGPFTNPKRILTRPVALLVTVIGDAETLAWLRRKGEIPLKHVWVHESVLRSERKHEPIRAGQFDDLPKLKAEVEATGLFDWRTTTNKSNLQRGQYEIRIQMKNGEPLRMLDGSLAIIHFDYQP